MEKEKWKDIKNYRGYQVSCLGRVRSLDRKITLKRGSLLYQKFTKGRIIKEDISKKGYCRVMLIKKKRELVHRLVAGEFILNRGEKSVIHHIDNNPRNNRVENLRWVTPSENQFFCVQQGRKNYTNYVHGERHPSSKLTKNKVVEIRKLKGSFSYRQLSKFFGVNHSSIKNIMLKRTWKNL